MTQICSRLDSAKINGRMALNRCTLESKTETNDATRYVCVPILG